MDSLGLRATDAELIKKRLTFLSRTTIWSERNPMASVLSVRKRDGKGNRQNNSREYKTNGECGAGTQRLKGNSRINAISFSKGRQRTEEEQEAGRKILRRNLFSYMVFKDMNQCDHKRG